MREQILHGGGPVWLEPEVVAAAQPARQAADQLPAAGQPAQPGQVIPADQDAQVYFFSLSTRKCITGISLIKCCGAGRSFSWSAAAPAPTLGS